jgi:hypothetical protein
LKVYLAGPMRGIPEFNFPAFYVAEEYLMEQGHEVFNPARRDNDRHGDDISKGNATGDEAVVATQHGFSLREALRDDTNWITMEADGIALLPGWEKSTGATAERALAIALHLEVMYLPGATPPTAERDPSGIDAKTPGAKLDAGKSPVFQGVLQYFPRALEAVAFVSEYGANKYAWKGWEKVQNGINRYANAAGRHILKEAIEGPWDLASMNDPKFPANILHKSQTAWNALASLELYLRENK